MSAAVASASSTPFPPLARDMSPKTSYPTLAPSTHSTSAERTQSREERSPPVTVTGSSERPAAQRSPAENKTSPNLSNSAQGPPKIIVKKEPPSSPTVQNTRHRPRKLDLSTNVPPSSGPGALSAAPRTAGGSLAMHDVGLACLSPGFQTHDPTMKEQLQRSISVREQQRSIIEARLQKTAKGDGPESSKMSEPASSFGAPKAPMGGKKRPPPAGLSIVPPSAQQFANERVIQSAPLNQTFTGRHDPPPMTRQVLNQQSNHSSTSHIHHVPAMQTNNRLPPISDVFGTDTLTPHNNRQIYYPPGSASESSHSNSRPPFPSPGLPPSGLPQNSGRPREYRSAEEAVHEMIGGREELLPRIVHYGGHQPPTPPSPLNGAGQTGQKFGHTSQPSNPGLAATSGRRRTRQEYEGDSSPPLSNGRESRPHGPFGAGRDSPETQRRKKDEFLSLCSRAWDLFHN